MCVFPSELIKHTPEMRGSLREGRQTARIFRRAHPSSATATGRRRLGQPRIAGNVSPPCAFPVWGEKRVKNHLESEGSAGLHKMVSGGRNRASVDLWVTRGSIPCTPRAVRHAEGPRRGRSCLLPPPTAGQPPPPDPRTQRPLR